MNLTGMTLVERVRYSDLEESFKDSLIYEIDHCIDIKSLRSELKESRVVLSEDAICNGNVSKLKKSELIELIDRYRSKFEEFTQSVEYHNEKLNEILHSLPVE